MTGAGGEDGDIASLQRDRAALQTAKLHLAFAAGDVEHLVDARVIVNIVVDAITPGIAPAIGREELLEHGSRIEPVIPTHRAAIENERPARVIGNDAVIL